MGDLVLVQRPNGLERAWSPTDGSEVVVALRPAAQVALKQANVPHHSTLSYLGKEGHQRILERSAEIVDRLRGVFRLKDERGVTAAYERTFFFHFRSYLHQWLFLLEIIHRAAMRHNPKRIIVVAEGRPAHGRKSVDRQSALLDQVARTYAGAHDMEVVSNTPPQRDERIKRAAFSLLKMMLFYVSFFLYSAKTKNLRTLILANDSYNMPDVVGRIRDQLSDIRPVYLDMKFTRKSWFDLLAGRIGAFFTFTIDAPKHMARRFGARLDELYSALQRATEVSPSSFVHNGVNIAPHLLEHIGKALLPEMHKLHGQVYALSKMLDAALPCMILSQHALGYGYALGEISRIRGIPALLISHGSHVPAGDECAKREWREHARTLINTAYPFVAVQTRWCEEFIREQNEFISQPLRTGPLLYGRFSQGTRKKDHLRNELYPEAKADRIVVHASTPKAPEFMRPWVYETVDEYVSNLNDVIKAISRIPGIYLAIRFRPIESLTTEQLRRLLVPSDRYGIYTEGKFEDHLLASDLLVSYSSTGIEEALQLRVPVLQYDAGGKYCHIPAARVGKDKNMAVSSIYYAGSREDLEFGLEWIDENHLRSRLPCEQLWDEHIIPADEELLWIRKMGVEPVCAKVRGIGTWNG